MALDVWRADRLCAGAEGLPGRDAGRHSNAPASRGVGIADIQRRVARMSQGDRDADQTHVLRARRVRHAQGGRHQLHILRLQRFSRNSQGRHGRRHTRFVHLTHVHLSIIYQSTEKCA